MRNVHMDMLVTIVHCIWGIHFKMSVLRKFSRETYGGQMFEVKEKCTEKCIKILNLS